MYYLHLKSCRYLLQFYIVKVIVIPMYVTFQLFIALQCYKWSDLQTNE